MDWIEKEVGNAFNRGLDLTLVDNTFRVCCLSEAEQTRHRTCQVTAHG